MTVRLWWYLGWLYGVDTAVSAEDLRRAEHSLRKLGYSIIDGVQRYQVGTEWLTEEQVRAMIEEIRGITGDTRETPISITGYRIRNGG
jgi:hypothetical protein